MSRAFCSDNSSINPTNISFSYDSDGSRKYLIRVSLECGDRPDNKYYAENCKKYGN